jgi:hypothetical protein
MRFERITMRPGQMGGQPCIRGLRIPVATIVDMVASSEHRRDRGRPARPRATKCVEVHARAPSGRH